MKKKHIPLRMLILLAGLLSMTGCMDLYGRITPSPEVLTAYTRRSGLPDYQYYYTGRAGLPDAVIGIDKKYRFDDRLWSKIETHDQVYQKIGHLNDTPLGDSNLMGADILDHNGVKLGIWFSFYAQTVVKQNSDGTLAVYTPYNPNDEEDGLLSL